MQGRTSFFYTGSRSVGWQVSSPSVFSFQETPEENSTRRVLHREAKLPSLGVPCVCRRPPTSAWTWTGLLGEWAPGEMQTHSTHSLGVHRFTSKVWNAVGVRIEKGVVPGYSSRWMCLQTQEEGVHRAQWAASCPVELERVHSYALA